MPRIESPVLEPLPIEHMFGAAPCRSDYFPTKVAFRRIRCYDNLMELERIRVREGERKTLTTGKYLFMRGDKVVGEVSIGKHPTIVRRIEGVRVFRVLDNDLTTDDELSRVVV